MASRDYVRRTVAAYEHSVDKYQESTGDMLMTPEMDKLVAAVPVPGPLLDAGCAFGRDSAYFAEHGYAVTGIDLTEQFIARAASLHPHIDFAVMDVRRLQFPDGHFGGIWCSAVLLHLKDEDAQGALQEFFRVLRPGGVLTVSVKEGTGSEEKIEAFSSDTARFFNYQTVASLGAMFQAAGFDIVESHILNEREQFGPEKRDLNWVWAFGRKPTHCLDPK